MTEKFSASKSNYSSYNTPIGRFSAAHQNERKVLKVEDEEPEGYPSIPTERDLSQRTIDPQKIMAVHKATKEKEGIDQEVKGAVEVLLGLGRSYRDVDVEGVTFTFRTLSPKEILDVMTDSLVMNPTINESLKNLTVGFLNRNLTLAFSLYRIDQQDWRYVLKTRDPYKKLEVLENMDEMVLDHLYNEYRDMIKMHKTKFSSVEEVADEIKK